MPIKRIAGGARRLAGVATAVVLLPVKIASLPVKAAVLLVRKFSTEASALALAVTSGALAHFSSRLSRILPEAPAALITYLERSEQLLWLLARTAVVSSLQQVDSYSLLSLLSWPILRAGAILHILTHIGHAHITSRQSDALPPSPSPSASSTDRSSSSTTSPALTPLTPLHPLSPPRLPSFSESARKLIFSHSPLGFLSGISNELLMVRGKYVEASMCTPTSGGGCVLLSHEGEGCQRMACDGKLFIGVRPFFYISFPFSFLETSPEAEPFVRSTCFRATIHLLRIPLPPSPPPSPPPSLLSLSLSVPIAPPPLPPPSLLLLLLVAVRVPPGHPRSHSVLPSPAIPLSRPTLPLLPP